MTLSASPVVLVAPSGTGKTTLAKRLVGDSGRYVFSVSATTRPRREGERHGIDYHFLTPDEFRDRVANGELAEWAEVHGCMYGTPLSELRSAGGRGEHVVLDIDVQGARQIKSAVPDATLIFVLPPSVGIMMARLEGRGTEGRADIGTRLRTALDELNAVSEFDHVVVNDELDTCVAEIMAIVEEGAAGATEAPDPEAFRSEIARILRDEYGEVVL